VTTPQNTTANPVEALKGATIGMRLRWRYMARTKSVSEEVKEGMVSTLTTSEGQADESSYAVSSKLFNPRMECFKKIAKQKGEIIRWWEGISLPYTEAGVRLLPRGEVVTATDKLFELKAQFLQLAEDVQAHREEIIQEARTRLKAGFDLANYPADLSTLFGMEWAFVSVDPPSYLAQLAPDVFQQECQKAQAALQESITLAQQAFALEFKAVVDTLHERLTPNADGSKKIFRDSAVENITEFIDRFSKLNITGQADLESLVLQAKALIANVEPCELRNLETLRQEVQQGLGAIKDRLEPLIVNKPRRKILKATPTPEVPDAALGVA
jgi:hypothetical protein